MQVAALGTAGKAQRLLATAQLVLKRNPPAQLDKAAKERTLISNQQKARKYLRQILDEYPSSPAAGKARQLLQGLQNVKE